MKDNNQLLVKAAQLYYEEDVNQNELADILSVSRPTVSRLLKRAKDEGIVEIIVHDPINKDHELSSRLREKFHLRDAVVITGKYGYEKALSRCCEASIQFLEAIMSDSSVIGIAWGFVPQTICELIRPHSYSDSLVVQMVGCLGTNNLDVDGSRLAIQLSQKLGGSYSNIHSPIYVHNKVVADYLCDEPAVRSTLDIAMHTDIVVNGIGSFDTESTIYKAGYWKDADLAELRSTGAVGHLLGRAYDINGRPVDMKDTYIVGAPFEALSNATWSVGVSASEMKAEATLGAIRGDFINVLIADQLLARRLLEIAD